MLDAPLRRAYLGPRPVEPMRGRGSGRATCFPSYPFCNVRFWCHVGDVRCRAAGTATPCGGGRGSGGAAAGSGGLEPDPVVRSDASGDLRASGPRWECGGRIGGGWDLTFGIRGRRVYVSGLAAGHVPPRSRGRAESLPGSGRPDRRVGRADPSPPRSDEGQPRGKKGPLGQVSRLVFGADCRSLSGADAGSNL